MAEQSEGSGPLAPLISTKVAGWLAIVFLVASAVLGVLVASYPEQKGFVVALGVVMAIGGPLGLLSGGVVRGVTKAIVLGLTGLAVLSSVACKHVPSVIVDVGKCAENAIIKQVEDQNLIKVLWAALLSGSWNAAEQAAITALISAAGDAGLCAWEVVRGQILGGVFPLSATTAGVDLPALMARVAAVDSALVANGSR